MPLPSFHPSLFSAVACNRTTLQWQGKCDRNDVKASATAFPGHYCGKSTTNCAIAIAIVHRYYSTSEHNVHVDGNFPNVFFVSHMAVTAVVVVEVVTVGVCCKQHSAYQSYCTAHHTGPSHLSMPLQIGVTLPTYLIRSTYIQNSPGLHSPTFTPQRVHLILPALL